MKKFFLAIIPYIVLTSCSHEPKELSEEQKQKVSKALKGKKRSAEFIERHTAFMRGENNPNRGKKRSEEAKAKTSATLKETWKKRKDAGEPWKKRK